MPDRSAGILLFRRSGPEPEVLLVLPGGPFWRGKNVGAWQLPKGRIEADESSEEAARREAGEELGITVAEPLLALGTIRQAGGKRVDAFALERDLDPAAIVSNRFEMEWPPRSGRRESFPEVEQGRWFTLAEARQIMLPSQVALIGFLAEQLGRSLPARARG